MLNGDPKTHYKDIAVAGRYDRERFSSFPGRVFNAVEKWCVRRAFKDLSRTSAARRAVRHRAPRRSPARCGFHVTGVDISGAMLEVAQRKLHRHRDRFKVQVADVSELARRDPSATMLLCARAC